MAYDRYYKFRGEKSVGRVPGISVPVQDSDYYVTYDRTKMRLDILSYDVYQDPSYDWLILQANTDITPFEFMIPNGARIRVPYPLDSALKLYERELDNYRKYYDTGDGNV